MITELSGSPLEHGWLPHRPETWQHHYASLKKPVVMQHFTGQWNGTEPVFRGVPCEAGRRVKIVMVSRFGDVGITEDLSAESGYGARVLLSDLQDFGDK